MPKNSVLCTEKKLSLRMQKVIILSGPSGAGKNTLGDILLKKFPQLSYSVSATTRNRRPDEQAGKDYHFLSVADFEQKIKNGDLLEWQEVYANTYYGTLKSELDRMSRLSQFPLLVIDVFGAINVMKNLNIKPLTIFIDALNLDILQERLTKRGTESAEKVAKRMEKAAVEISEKKHFDITIVNDDLQTAEQQLTAIVKHFLLYK
jgi:guanylate kinase